MASIMNRSCVHSRNLVLLGEKPSFRRTYGILLTYENKLKPFPQCIAYLYPFQESAISISVLHPSQAMSISLDSSQSQDLSQS